VNPTDASKINKIIQEVKHATMPDYLLARRERKKIENLKRRRRIRLTFVSMLSDDLKPNQTDTLHILDS
jgi:HD superfamily phosphodiesterase